MQCKSLCNPIGERHRFSGRTLIGFRVVCAHRNRMILTMEIFNISLADESRAIFDQSEFDSSLLANSNNFLFWTKTRFALINFPLLLINNCSRTDKQLDKSYQATT